MLPTWQAPWPLRSHGRVFIRRSQMAAVEQISIQCFGRALRRYEFAGLAGAPDDAALRIDSTEGMIRLELRDGENACYCGAHLVRLGATGPEIIAGGWRILLPALRGTSFGLQMFRRQLLTAHGLDVRRILTLADRGRRESGYYIWPRYGLDGPVPSAILGRLREARLKARSVLDLMGTAAGRAWWREHGTSFEGSFDLSEGSRHWRVFRRYVRSKLVPLRGSPIRRIPKPPGRRP
jgi:hypothetical protein